MPSSIRPENLELLRKGFRGYSKGLIPREVLIKYFRITDSRFRFYWKCFNQGTLSQAFDPKPSRYTHDMLKYLLSAESLQF